MNPALSALIVSIADAVLDLLLLALGPDATRAKLEERAAILAARTAADAAARRKFGDT